jgi:hypothetical protein
MDITFLPQEMMEHILYYVDNAKDYGSCILASRIFHYFNKYQVHGIVAKDLYRFKCLKRRDQITNVKKNIPYAITDHYMATGNIFYKDKLMQLMKFYTVPSNGQLYTSNTCIPWTKLLELGEELYHKPSSDFHDCLKRNNIWLDGPTGNKVL